MSHLYENVIVMQTAKDQNLSRKKKKKKNLLSNFTFASQVDL